MKMMKKLMKKTTVFLLLSILSLGIFGCGNNNSDEATNAAEEMPAPPAVSMDQDDTLWKNKEVTYTIDEFYDKFTLVEVDTSNWQDYFEIIEIEDPNCEFNVFYNEEMTMYPIPDQKGWFIAQKNFVNGYSTGEDHTVIFNMDLNYKYDRYAINEAGEKMFCYSSEVSTSTSTDWLTFSGNAGSLNIIEKCKAGESEFSTINGQVFNEDDFQIDYDTIIDIHTDDDGNDVLTDVNGNEYVISTAYMPFIDVITDIDINVTDVRGSMYVGDFTKDDFNSNEYFEMYHSDRHLTIVNDNNNALWLFFVRGYRLYYDRYGVAYRGPDYGESGIYVMTDEDRKCGLNLDLIKVSEFLELE